MSSIRQHLKYVFLLGAIIWWMHSLQGCAFEVEHEGLDEIKADVGVDLLSGLCGGCRPSCAGTFHCTPLPDSPADCSDCYVGCVGGKVLMCTLEGPTCYNDFGHDSIKVPVLCLAGE